jgi:serine/threonine-protein kinase HipA
MTIDLIPEKIKRLAITIASDVPAMPVSAELTKESGYTFSYLRDDSSQASASLLLRPKQLTFNDSELFPSMDMNLPEGFLLQRIFEMFPKRKLNKMHLLAMMGDNAIGRVGYFLPERPAPAVRHTLSKAALLKTPFSDLLFRDLVNTYLSTGIGISGVQPKIMIPSKASLPIPDLIVKAAGAEFPGLAANEYLCLSVARIAKINVPSFELSNDGQLLVIDRFDVTEQGQRLGFEDMAALMDLRVNDRLDNRKYFGNYQYLAKLIGQFSSQAAQDRLAFFEQLSLSIMVRNGDAHLKNFGMLYQGKNDSSVRLSPLYDVVTTTIYKFERPGGFEDIDRTMALKLQKGRHGSRSYPTRKELLEFGRTVCGVVAPEKTLQRISDAMSQVLQEAKQDSRIDPSLYNNMAKEWAVGITLGSDSAH